MAVAVAVAVDADGTGLAVEMAAELAVAAVAVGARGSLVVGVMVTAFFWQSLDSVDAVANIRRTRFHCLILCQRLESYPMASTSTRCVLQLCQCCPWAWLDQLCGFLSRQQLCQQLELFFAA